MNTLVCEAIEGEYAKVQRAAMPLAGGALARTGSMRFGTRPELQPPALLQESRRMRWIWLFPVIGTHALAVHLLWSMSPTSREVMPPTPVLVRIISPVSAPKKETPSDPLPPRRRVAPSRSQASPPALATPVPSLATTPLPLESEPTPVVPPQSRPLSPELGPVPVAPSLPVPSPEPSAAVAAAAPAAPPAPRAEPIQAPRFDADYLDNPAPAYPALSRRLGEQGRVLLRVFVNADGSAAQVEIRESSGFERLDRAAREAVARWRFVPARQGDRPVAAWVLVPISFNLRS